jgi:RNA-directed DNA polymerase
MVLARPRKKKRTEFLRALKATMWKCLHRPVAEVVRRIVNPRVRGWVNYFRWGNASRDLKFVSWQVDTKVRKFASRQRPKRRGGRAWTTWSAKDIYETWGLFHDYRVLPRSESRMQRG